MTPKNKSMRLVMILAALSLALVACAQDDGTTASSDTTMDSGTVTTDTVGDTTTTVASTTDTGSADEDEDLMELSDQASVISTHVAEADVEEVTEGWTVIQDHLDRLTMNGSSIDESLRETLSADLDAFDTTIQGYESTLSSEFVADWESFHADFQAMLSVTG